MERGDWIEQKNTETIALVQEQLKNGAWKVLVHDWRGRVVQKTTNGWYPEPVIIPVSAVPQTVKDKVSKYILRKTIFG